MSTEQKRNLYGLLIFGTAVGIAAAIIVASGAANYFEDETARATILNLIVAATAGWLGMMSLTRPRGDEKEVVRDERDQIIADRSRKVAAAATNVCLLVSGVVPIEAQRADGSAPVVFFFMAMSTIVVSQLLQGVAMLIGYPRS